MATTTLKARLLQMEWAFHSLGLDAAFNELYKFSESTIGNLAGTTIFGDIDLASAVMVLPTSGVPNTGGPIPPGLKNAGWGVPNVTNSQLTTSGGATSSRPPTLNEP